MEKSDMFVHCFHSAFTSMKDILYILAVFQKKKKTYSRSFYFYPSNYNLHLRSVNKIRLNVTQTKLQAVVVTTGVIVLPKLYQ